MHNILNSMSSHHFPRNSTSFKKKEKKIKKVFFLSQFHGMIQNINVLEMNNLFPARPRPAHLSGLNLLGLESSASSLIYETQIKLS